jgi:serine/threonine protein kinase
VKPSNVILDAAGKAWVTDFGLARIESDATLTISGDLLGTVRYMSPEQALARRVVVDHRTDVYSLGVTLYELLTLQPAFGGQDREELLRQIAFEEPKQPQRLNKSVPAELETIVLTAMSKSPAERYDTAGEFADDLERFLEDKPIRARRPSLAQRAAKWSRRHRTVVWSAVLLLAFAAVTLAVGTVLIWSAKREAEVALDEARGEAAKSDAVIELLREMLTSAGPFGAKGHEYTVRELLDDFSQNLGDQLKDQPEVEATIRSTIGRAYAQLFIHEEADLHLRQAIRLYRELPDGDDSRLADTLIDHVWIGSLDRNGDVDLKELESEAHEAVAIFKRLKDDAGTIRALYALHHHLLFGQERPKDSDKVFAEASRLAFSPNSHPPPEFATMVHNQGSSRFKRGELDEAMSLCRQAVDLHLNLHGPAHPQTAFGLKYLGRCYMQSRDYPAAEECFRQSLAIFAETYPWGSQVEGAVDELMQLLEAQGRVEDLTKLLQEYGDLDKGESATAEKDAFVVLDAHRSEVDKFDTLAEAVEGSNAGDTIEVRGNGPFFTDPMQLRHPLVIRAADGFRPVIQANPKIRLSGDLPLLEARDLLVLEGLDVRTSPWQSVSGYTRLLVSRGRIRAANCRFFFRPDVTGRSLEGKSDGDLCNCLLIGRGALSWCVISEARIDIQNCILVGGLYPIFDAGIDATLQLSGNTVLRADRNHGLINPELRDTFQRVLDTAPSNRLQIVASSNILDWSTAALQFQLRSKPEAPSDVTEVEGLLPRSIHWRGERNVFRAGHQFLDFSIGWKKTVRKAERGRNLEGWNRFWGLAGTGSLEGTILYQDVSARVKALRNPEQLTPDDFRLRPDSAGYQAGPDGKDLGADVDLVGPGEAYERWKRTPEYEQWQKETQELLMNDD